MWYLFGFYALLAIAVYWMWKRHKSRVAADDAARAARSTHGPATSVMAGEKRSGEVTWDDRRLFDDGYAQQRRQRLADGKVDPADLPVTDTRDYTYGSLTPVLASLLPESDAKKAVVKRELQNAGYYQPHAYQNLSATRYLGIVLPLIGILSMLVFLPQQLEAPAIAALLILPILGWALPRLLVRSEARERLSQIENAMPDMLDMLNMCVSQGMTVPAALHRVSGELRPVYPALAKELQIVVEQADVGTLEQSLMNFADRVELPEVHSFTTLMVQTERMGTSVSQALADYSDNMRESQRQRADEKANTATFKLLFPTVACLMPAVFLFLLGPAIIQLSDFFTGDGQRILNSETPELDQFREQ